MPKDNKQLHLEKKKEAITIQTYVNPLYVGQDEQEAPAEQLQTSAPSVELQRERAANLTMVASLQQQFPATQVQTVSPGTPVQEEAPANLSVKKRLQNHFHAKSARKVCPVGTAATYDMVTSLQKLSDRKDVSMRGNQTLIAQSGVDTQVLKAFVIGYKADKKGVPVSPKDKKLKEEDEAFLADYCSKDVTRRKPHLDRVIDELLGMRHDPSLLSDWNVRQNIDELKSKCDKINAIRAAMADPINAPYFDQMAPATHELLKSSMNKLFPPFIDALHIVCKKQGVNLDNAQYYGYDAIQEIAEGQLNAYDMVHNTYRNAIDTINQRKVKLDARQADRVKTAAMDFTLRRQEKLRTFQRIADSPDLNLEEQEKHTPAFMRLMMLINPGEEHYDENLDMLRTAMEIQQVQAADQVSTPVLYDHAKELLAAKVKKILAYDVDSLLTLDDEALLVRAPELNELMLDAAVTNELIQLKHPSMSIWKLVVPGEPMEKAAATLKEDILGPYSAEYDFKLQLLQQITYRARCLALLRQEETMGIDRRHQFWVRDFQPTLTDQDTLKNELAQNTELMRQARQAYENRFISGTKECQDYMAALSSGFTLKERLDDSPLVAAGEEVLAEETPEAIALRQRLRLSHYYTLSCSEQELKDRGLPLTIGEPIFRSFKSFSYLEAAQKLLTPDQMRQMIRDIGAGYQMHNGEWLQAQNANGDIVHVKRPGTPEAELKVAQEKNARGFAVYKRVIKAQYEMMIRKYGNSMQNMTLEDILAHYDELRKDFANVQVDNNIISKIPDFVDMNDPEDALLANRQLFFNAIGMIVTSGFLSSLENMTGKDVLMEQLQNRWETVAAFPDYVRALDYLIKNDPLFQHKLDWSQKV